jgi:hypothetical protein
MTKKSAAKWKPYGWRWKHGLTQLLKQSESQLAVLLGFSGQACLLTYRASIQPHHTCFGWNADFNKRQPEEISLYGGHPTFWSSVVTICTTYINNQ